MTNNTYMITSITIRFYVHLFNKFYFEIIVCLNILNESTYYVLFNTIKVLQILILYFITNEKNCN